MKLNRRDFMKSIAALLATLPLSRVPEGQPSATIEPEVEGTVVFTEPGIYRETVTEEWLDPDLRLTPQEEELVRQERDSHYQTLHIGTPLAEFRVETYTPSDDWGYLKGEPETTVYATWRNMSPELVENLRYALVSASEVTISLDPSEYLVSGTLNELAVEVGDMGREVRATIQCREMLTA